MMTYTHLCDPSHFVDADLRPIPPDSVFKEYDAHRLCPDDLVMVGGEIYRVKTKQLDNTFRTIIFCLWPVKGGKVEVVNCEPRDQIMAVLQDTEGSTKPLSSIR